MHITLYIIAFLEGFTTLSVEIMAIRNSIAIIGSNAISTSIILGIILLALSYGYYRGWVYASVHAKEEIRKKIYWNLLIASVFYTFVSFPLENKILRFLLDFDIGYFIPVSLAISLLFILPVFLASQTIPLLSELIDDDQKAIILGKLLFYSTIGSFLGSVMTSLVFFSAFGVEKSIVLNGLILAFLALLVMFQFQKRDRSRMRVPPRVIYRIAFSPFLRESLRYLSPSDRVYAYSSPYNNIEIFDRGESRLFTMNGSYSSGLDVAAGKSFFPYIQEITRIIDEKKPKKVLVIGAAGFTLPQDIAKREYIEQVDVCDIDGSLDVIAEQYFLKERLHPKIHFYKESARYFIKNKIRSGEKYDMIFLDAYSGRISVPSELLTLDFFESVEKLSQGIIAMNLILDRDRSSDFTRKLENTITAALPEMYISPMTPYTTSFFDNFIVIGSPIPWYTPLTSTPNLGIYTDDQNSLEYDKYELFYTHKFN